MLAAIVAELLIGIPAGIYAASRRGRLGDKIAMTLSFASVSTPQFVLGLTLLYVFAYLLNWLPLGGYGSFSHLILPAVTLGLAGGGWYSRMMRSSISRCCERLYPHGAGQGHGGVRVVARHGLRNAILPIVANDRPDIGIFMSGVVVVENVFGGRASASCCGRPSSSLDPHHHGITTVAACFIVLGNLMQT